MTSDVAVEGKEPSSTKRKQKDSKPLMVVTDDDLRDISNCKKYKIKTKPISLHRLYMSNEKARRANKREEKLYEHQKQELRRKFNIELVKLEFEYQIENASKLALEENKILAEKEAREKRRTAENEEEKPKEDKLPPIRKAYHGYISEPGSKRTGNTSMKKGDNDVLSKHKAIAENWAREERIKAHYREKKCKKLLKKEKLNARTIQKRQEKFNNKDWVGDILDDVMDDEDFFNDNAGVDFTGVVSDSDDDSVVSDTTMKQRKLNNIRDNFLRCYLKYDTNENKDEELTNYLERHDSPVKRNAVINPEGAWVASYSGRASKTSGRGSRVNLSRSASRTSMTSDVHAQYEPLRYSLPDINQAMKTARRTRYLRFSQPTIHEQELTCDEILE